MPRTSLLVLLASLSVCSPRTSPQPEPRPGGEPPAPAAADPASPARTSLDRSSLAARRGALDVAAAHLGRAAALEPTPERLWSHVDALVELGDHRRARAVLERARDDAGRPGDAAIRQQIDARLAALPPSPARSIAPIPPTGPLLAAYEAEAAGLAGAADAFLAALSGDAGPYHLAHAADLLWSRGEHVEARRLWSRARALLHDAGATVQPLPVERWHTAGAAWHGDAIALLRYLSPVSPLLGEPAGALELAPARPDAAPTRGLHLARPASVFALSADGRTLVRDDRGSVVLQDMLSGTELRRIDVDGARVLTLAVDGAGDDMRVLVGAESAATLWSARGEQLGRFPLAGTTPTIIRRYTGEGSYHENILQDSPTWPVALAMTPGARMLAIGGSDSTIRLVDRDRGTTRELAFKWPYEERRHMGANPDLNLPLALRFRDGGAELVAVHTHGDLLIWDTRKAAVRKRISGACSPAEAEPFANRYNEPGAPRRPATDDERESCGHATTATISPDGRTVVVGGSLAGARVRDATTGAGIAMLLAEDMPDRYMSLAPSGALALVDLYGARAVWRPGLASAERLAGPEPSSPIDPHLSSQGRFLVFSIDQHTTVAWDLRERRRIDAAGSGERLLALAPDGRFAVVLAAGALEVRDLRTRTALHHAATTAHPLNIRASFSSGHVLIDMPEGAGRVVTLVALPGGAARRLPAEFAGRELELGEGWVAGLGRGLPLELWRVDGGARQALDLDTRHLAFARDGSFIAWLAQADPGQPRVVVRTRPLAGDGPAAELALDGWPEDIAIDGADVLALLQNARLVRWRPATGEHRLIEDHWLIGIRRIAVADDGKTVFCTGYDRVDVRRNDDALTLLAHLFPLRSGGWLALSRAGAVDGSDDAASHLIARVAGQGGEFVASGRLVWDALHSDDVLARSLAGDDTPPPVVLPAPPPPK